MKVKEIMTRYVEGIMPQKSIKETAEKMKDNNVGIIPVIDGNSIAGVITDRDIVLRAVAEGRDPNFTKAADIMTFGIIQCLEDDDVTKAAKIMKEKQIRRLLVENSSGEIVGVLSLGDLALHINQNLAGEVLKEISE